MAVTTLVVGVPLFTFLYLIVPSEDMESESSTFLLFAPYVFALAYLILGYLTVMIGSALYNILYKFIGGIEFEQKDRET